METLKRNAFNAKSLIKGLVICGVFLFATASIKAQIIAGRVPIPGDNPNVEFRISNESNISIFRVDIINLNNHGPENSYSFLIDFSCNAGFSFPFQLSSGEYAILISDLQYLKYEVKAIFTIEDGLFLDIDSFIYEESNIFEGNAFIDCHTRPL